MEDLSLREQEILEFIKNAVKKHGYPPSVREIGTAVGLKSSSTVHGYLASLEEKGYIRRDPAKPRAIEVLDDESMSFNNKEMVHIPLVGKIAAGSPVLAEENIEDIFPLPYDLVRASDTFMLTVKGDSMIGAGILEGDMLIVKKQNYASNGDIVVALLEDEATVKRFFKEKGHFRLQPENEYLEPIITDDVTILGKVIGLIRRY